MLKAKIHIVMTFAILFFCILSCRKTPKAAANPTTPDKIVLLTGKKWQMTAMTRQLTSGQTIDAYTTLSWYDKDDYFFFYTNFEFEWNANTLKLPGSTEALVDAGTWKVINSNAIELKSKNPAVTYSTFTIRELTSNELTIETIDIYNGSNNIVWITYTPI